MSRNHLFTLGMSVGLLLIGYACVPKADTKAEADLIRAIEDEWTAANRAGDVDKIMGLVSEDFAYMIANQPIAIGPEALKKMLETQYADKSLDWGSFSWTSDLVEVSSSGDLAYVRGSSRLNYHTVNGPMTEVGKGLDVFKKTDGKWKAVASNWSNDQPESYPVSTPALVEEFSRIEEGWNKAVQDKDAKALDQLYAAEYTYTDETGKVYTKEEDIRDITSADYKVLATGVISGIEVISYGNLAMVKGQNTVKAVFKGKNISGTYRFVDWFVWRDGRWQCVSTMSSKVK